MITTEDQPPNASFTYSPSLAATDEDVQFTDTSTDPDSTIVSWSWSFGDGGTSTAQNPTHRYSSEGTYTVTLTVTDDDGLTDSQSGSLDVGENYMEKIEEAIDSLDIRKLTECWEFAESDECSEEYREQLKDNINQAWAQIDKSGSHYTFKEFVDRFVKKDRTGGDDRFGGAVSDGWVTLNLSSEFVDTATEIYNDGLEEFNNNPYLAIYALSYEIGEFIEYSDKQGETDHSATSIIETASTPKGDCSDHAHLLIDVLRRMNIPARKIGVWGHQLDGTTYGHAVVEAYINGEWRAFDPTNTLDDPPYVRRMYEQGFDKKFWYKMLGPVTDACYVDPIDGTTHSLEEYTTPPAAPILVYY